MSRLLSVLVVVLGCAAGVRADDDEVQKLIDVLKDPDKSVQTKNSAISQLGKRVGETGSKSEATLAALKDLLPHPGHRFEVIVALGRFGKSGEKAVPLLLEVLKDPYPHKLPLSDKLPPEQFAKASAEVLKEYDNKNDALNSLGVIGETGGDASAAVKPLIAFSSDKEVYKLPNGYTSKGLQLAALKALRQVATDDTAKEVASHIASFLKEKDALTLEAALFNLKLMGPRASAATPAIVAIIEKFLKEGKEAVPLSRLYTSIAILQAIGPGAADALPVLRELLKKGEYLPVETERAIDAIKAKKK